MLGQPRTSLAHLSNSPSIAARLPPPMPIGFCSTSAETRFGLSLASASANETPMHAPIA